MTNINFNGGNFSGVQVGDNNTQTNHHAINTPELQSRFFAIVTESVPSDIVADVVEPLQTLASLPEEEQKSPEVVSRVGELCSRLAPYAGPIAKGVGVFGAAALASMANSNPIIAGIAAVCRMAGDA